MSHVERVGVLQWPGDEGGYFWWTYCENSKGELTLLSCGISTDFLMPTGDINNIILTILHDT